MTSKERVRCAINHKQPDRVPANFECVAYVKDKLLKHYGYSEQEQLLQRFEIDIRGICPTYIGPELYTRMENGHIAESESFWGHRYTYHWTGKDYNAITSYYG